MNNTTPTSEYQLVNSQFGQREYRKPHDNKKAITVDWNGREWTICTFVNGVVTGSYPSFAAADRSLYPR